MNCGPNYVRYFQSYNLNQIMRTLLYSGRDICLKLLLLPQDVRAVIHPLVAFPFALKLPDAALPVPSCCCSPASCPPVPPWSGFCPHSLSWVPLCSMPQQLYFSARGLKQPAVSKNPLGAVGGRCWAGALSNQPKLHPCLIPKNLPGFIVVSLKSICTALACKLPAQGAGSVRTDLLLVDLKSLKIRGFRLNLCLFFFFFCAPPHLLGHPFNKLTEN